MITIHVIFDRAVFLTSSEYKEVTGEEVNVQADVEQHEVYLLAMRQLPPDIGSDGLPTLRLYAGCIADSPKDGLLAEEGRHGIMSRCSCYS